MLALTDADLRKIQARVTREKNPLHGAAEIGQAVSAVLAVLDKRTMAKLFELTISDATFSFARKAEAITDEARFDGFYGLCTSLPTEQINTAGTVRADKRLAQVEPAFRSIKTVELALRPVFHWTAPRVRLHVLLCMLASRTDCWTLHRSASPPDYLEWHVRQPLAPMLVDAHDRTAAEAERTSPVAKAKVSNAA